MGRGWRLKESANEFAADDRRMRGARAMLGDDRGGALHDRHPVRVRGLGDQDGAIREAANLRRIANEADLAGDNGIANAETRDQPPPRQFRRR